VRTLRSKLTLALLISSCLALAGSAQTQQPSRPAARPKLVVVLVVDQMRTDYIEMYGRQWKQGLRRLVDRGAWFRHAAYSYWNTVTCPGHATIGTGAGPATHGMVLNTWWDHASNSQANCSEDPSVENIGTPGTRTANGDSPHRLLVPTLADEMRAQIPGGTRVVTFSVKARAAILLAGHKGDAVMWYGRERGVETSTYYTASVPEFISSFVKEHPIEADVGKHWQLHLPAKAYRFEDDAEWERAPTGWSRTFPHPLGPPGEPTAAFYAAWGASPYSDAYLGQLAVAAVDALRLGQGGGTDYMAIGFSALDSVGHLFGPRSFEVQDTLARLDATIGKLFDHLDREVGAENYVVALSSDHGVAPIPEQLQAEGIDAGRVPTRELVQQVEKALEPFLGAGPHVARLNYTDLSFRPGVYDKLKADPRVMRAVEKAILSVPGVWRVLWSEELASGPAKKDPARKAVAVGYYPGRSGDLAILAKPNWISSSSATTHGSGHPYDARVPVILMGPGIRPGRYSQAATPADIAPTLAALCGVNLPRADGRVLEEALEVNPRGQQGPRPH